MLGKRCQGSTPDPQPHVLEASQMISREEILFTGKYTARNAQPRRSCVLLVEDDQSLRRYLEILLKKAGFEVVTALDGVEAMKVALTNTDVDIVVTDAMMPNMNGYQLSRSLKTTPAVSHLPVILLSALEPKDTCQDADHVDVFLCKPVSHDDLILSIDNLLSRPRKT